MYSHCSSCYLFDNNKLNVTLLWCHWLSQALHWINDDVTLTTSDLLKCSDKSSLPLCVTIVLHNIDIMQVPNSLWTCRVTKCSGKVMPEFLLTSCVCPVCRLLNIYFWRLELSMLTNLYLLYILNQILFKVMNCCCS